MDLHFRETGAGRPLVILHGVFGSSDNWMTIAKALADEFRVIVVDQRNHGQSPHSDEFDYELLTQDLAEFISAQALQSPIVLGHSMGGKVAMNFALHYGQMLDKLVVVDIAPREYPLHHQAILQAFEQIDLSGMQTRQEVDRAMQPFLPDLSTRQFILKNLYRKPEGGFGWRLNVSSLSRNIAHVGARIDGLQPFLKPVLVVAGEKSRYILEQDKEDFARLFPAYQFAVVAQAGHWVHAEAPEGFLAVVRPFLRG